MAPPIDYGSTLAFILFMHELALVVVLVARPLVRRRTTRDRSNADYGSMMTAVDDSDDHELDDNTRFLYDLVARGNETTVQNIDALDNGLIAIAVGVIAVALVVAETWTGMQPALRFSALTLLTEAGIVALLGYLATYLGNTGPREIVRISELVADFTMSPADVTEQLIATLADVSTANRGVRFMKRAFIASATVLTFAAVVLTVSGRIIGN